MAKKRLTLRIEPKLSQMASALAARGLTLGGDGSELTYVYDPSGSQDAVPALLEALREAGLQVKDLETTQSSLEDIFVNLVREDA